MPPLDRGHLVAAATFAAQCLAAFAEDTAAPSALPTPAPTRLPGTAGASSSSADDDDDAAAMMTPMTVVMIVVGIVLLLLVVGLIHLFYTSKPPSEELKAEVRRLSIKAAAPPGPVEEEDWSRHAAPEAAGPEPVRPNVVAIDGLVPADDGSKHLGMLATFLCCRTEGTLALNGDQRPASPPTPV